MSPAHRLIRARLIAALAALMLLATGCGGGGSGSTASSSGTSGGTPSLPPDNVLGVTVENGPFNVANVPYASVTLCAPGGTDCQAIDHLLIDTGSTGLRLFASVMTPQLQQDFAQQTAGKPVTGECTQFADGYTWGSIRKADVRLAGKSLSGIAVQIVGETGFAVAPNSCVGTGPSLNTPQSFGANGVIGIGSFLQDCGPACVLSAATDVYYTCTGSTCQPVTMPLSQQVLNPVSLFASDNNGVVLSLPAVSAAGASTVNGSLMFGIGTQANNAIDPAATVLATNPDTGYFTTIYKGVTLAKGFIDSGSNGFFFNDSSLPTCNHGFYCPATTQSATATNQGINGTTSTVGFSIANADRLFTGNLAAFNDLAGSGFGTNSFDWGLSFFFGRSVFTAIEGKSTPRGAGPYFAY